MKKNAIQGPRDQGPNAALLMSLLPTAAMFSELREFVVQSGIRVLAAVLEQERAAACGPRYQHQPERAATRSGSTTGTLVLGGRKVRVKRPRAHATNGDEVVLPSWARFTGEDPLIDRTVEQMVVGVSTRKYERSLEPVDDGVETTATSKSAVSRRFVAATQAQLDEWLATDLSGLNLVALMIDGIHFGEHLVLCALGIDASGAKHVLGLWEGATENATACRDLLTNLRDRGVRTDRTILVVIDGGKALAKAVRQVFGKRALIQRCQVHKMRNVLDQLPEKMRVSVRKAMNDAYRTGKVERAKRLLNNLERRLQPKHPGAAASLREGLDETLTVMAFGLDHTLERTLSTTNPIENLNGTTRHVARRVKQWQGGSMVLRWVAAGVREASKGFRRLRGCDGMKRLITQLTLHDRKQNSTVDAAQEAA